MKASSLVLRQERLSALQRDYLLRRRVFLTTRQTTPQSASWVDGINNILPTCALVISVFGIMGVLSDAGMLNLIAEKILDSKMAGTARGAELVCMMGIAFYNDLTLAV